MNEIEDKIKFIANIIIILFNINISMGLVFVLGLVFNQSKSIFGTMNYLLIPMIVFLVITYVGNSLLLKEINHYQNIKNKN
jgi:hypothetical protein